MPRSCDNHCHRRRYLRWNTNTWKTASHKRKNKSRVVVPHTRILDPSCHTVSYSFSQTGFNPWALNSTKRARGSRVIKRHSRILDPSCHTISHGFSQMGKVIITIDGYSFGRSFSQGTRIYWKCTKVVTEKCPARITKCVNSSNIIHGVRPHNHPPYV
nr:uncharacterized protein LOC109403961 [Aedes albopictus]